jgi:DNA-binding LytR/AlgR family response regulator
MSLSCAIVDDEYLAIKILEEYISRMSFIHLVRSFKDPLEAVEYLQKNKIDILFLDIQMPYINGVELLKKLSSPPLVIFTTARHEFAVQAFELNAMDYLVKPISFQRFDKAITKADQYLQLMKGDKSSSALPGFLLVKSDYQIVKLLHDEIILIEGLSEYVKVHTHEKKIITLAALKDLETQLPSEKFIRIHKSYIVSLHHVKSYNAAKIMLSNGLQLPVGRVYKENLMKHFRNR